MSRRSSRHRKSSRHVWPLPNRNARHRKPSPITTALQQQPARLAAGAAASTLIVTGVPAATHWTGTAAPPAAMAQAHAFSSLAGTYLGTQLSQQVRAARLATPSPAGTRASSQPSPPAVTHSPARLVAQQHRQAPPPPTYRNPLRDVSGLLPERVDMGVDFGGSGPVYALGDGVVTNADGSNAGWPGGGWITYRLTDGPDAGMMVFVAEDVTPTVQPGQHVTSASQIATMYNGGDGIETGWAMPSGLSAESQLPEAGGISGNGPFPTMIGMNFEELLQYLGVPAGNNAAQSAYGTLPPNYPTSWK